jgi:hypothetical protein
MSTLQNLHDATFRSFDLDWATGDFKAYFSGGIDAHELVIIGKDLKSFSCKRSFPWGRSVSVNKCIIESKSAGEVLTIEMQSGDSLVGIGGSFVISN